MDWWVDKKTEQTEQHWTLVYLNVHIAMWTRCYGIAYQWNKELSVDCLSYILFLKYQTYLFINSFFNKKKTLILQPCAKLFQWHFVLSHILRINLLKIEINPNCQSGLDVKKCESLSRDCPQNGLYYKLYRGILKHNGWN